MWYLVGMWGIGVCSGWVLREIAWKIELRRHLLQTRQHIDKEMQRRGAGVDG